MPLLPLRVNRQSRDVDLGGPETPLLYVLRNDPHLRGRQFRPPSSNRPIREPRDRVIRAPIIATPNEPPLTQSASGRATHHVTG